MGTNTPARAADEAAFVARTLGATLQYFQIGNEPDLFDRHLRDPRTWSSKAYLDEWLAIARAVSARVPGATFGMPDVASRVAWLTDVAAAWPTLANPPHVTTLTHHFYFGGPATNPDVNIPNLLKPATVARVQRTADEASAAADKMGARVRMTEGNTCYRGGKPGLSDVFAAALWSADYSLLLARNNYWGSTCMAAPASRWPCPLAARCQATRCSRNRATRPRKSRHTRILSTLRLPRLTTTMWSNPSAVGCNSPAC